MIKFKRCISVVLLCTFIMCFLSACGKTAGENFFDLYSQLKSLKQSDIHEEVVLNIPKNLSQSSFLTKLNNGTALEDLEKDISLYLLVDGTINMDKKVLSLDVSYKMAEEDTYEILTDIKMDDKFVYINMKTILDAIDKKQTSEDDFIFYLTQSLRDSLQGKDYMATPMTEANVDAWTTAAIISEGKLPEGDMKPFYEYLNKIVEIVKTRTMEKGTKYFTKVDGEYVLSIDEKVVKNILLDILNDASNNLEYYYDSFITLTKSQAVISGQIPKDEVKDVFSQIDEEKEVLMANVAEKLTQYVKIIDEYEFAPIKLFMGIGFDKSSGTYKTRAGISIENTIELLSNSTATNVTAKEVTIPTDYFDVTQQVESVALNEVAPIAELSPNVEAGDPMQGSLLAMLGKDYSSKEKIEETFTNNVKTIENVLSYNEFKESLNTFDKDTSSGNLRMELKDENKAGYETSYMIKDGVVSISLSKVLPSVSYSEAHTLEYCNYSNQIFGFEMAQDILSQGIKDALGAKLEKDEWTYTNTLSTNPLVTKVKITDDIASGVKYLTITTTYTRSIESIVKK